MVINRGPFREVWNDCVQKGFSISSWTPYFHILLQIFARNFKNYSLHHDQKRASMILFLTITWYYHNALHSHPVLWISLVSLSFLEHEEYRTYYYHIHPQQLSMKSIQVGTATVATLCQGKTVAAQTQDMNVPPSSGTSRVEAPLHQSFVWGCKPRAIHLWPALLSHLRQSFNKVGGTASCQQN